MLPESNILVIKLSLDIHPKKLDGPWNEGYALDVQTVESTYIGDNEFGRPMFDTKRSPVGELLYQLKYHNDSAAIEPLVETAAAFLKDNRVAFDLIVPIPPSNPYRKSQPVIEVAKGLSKTLNTALCEKCVLKVKSTQQLKNIYDIKERERILNGAFSVDTQQTRGKHVLLFDDLYRSGATMQAVAALLKGAGEAGSVAVLTLTYTRSLR